MMTERQKQTVSDAVFVWELGLLRFLYEKGILTEEEYHGIYKIATEQKDKKVFVS